MYQGAMWLQVNHTNALIRLKADYIPEEGEKIYVDWLELEIKDVAVNEETKQMHIILKDIDTDEQRKVLDLLEEKGWKILYSSSGVQPTCC